ncbi:glycosyltransferase family 39 protein [Butyrivibrio sp. VCB2001]|uniref:glycosyltransferase family 39 protein n=1 Tax=Butyrivibrio sp. VCB2001 TaxID=1280667 RepID=UPI000479F79E|nr:glycosyltransferase family 39 protein [Butyrivibrio sp. VCB2001]
MNESLTYKTEKRIYNLLPHEPEAMATTLFIIAMSSYYLWRMFAITPQYDELYTYYTFISRGVIYSAIHWPLPNNHVGYSVLSAFLYYLGNPFIALRGVSFICAISNLILVYRICKRYYSHGLAFGALLLYSAMQVVVEYSVQGRGYTLATTCFLLSVYIAGFICSLEDTKPSYYVCIAFAFVMGLYTVPSSVYWVIPVSVAISVYLLVNAYKSRQLHDSPKDNVYYRKFMKFFVYGLIAASITAALYALIWLAIGSNLLVKTEGSEYYGLSHATVLVRAPVSSLLKGMEYMLGQPYIQSLSAEDFRAECVGWVLRLYNYMIPGFMYIIPVIVLASIIVAGYECIRHFAYSRTIINLMIISNIIVTMLMLILQRKLPYLRVFSYGGFILTICFCACFERLINVFIRIYNNMLRKKAGAATENIAHKESETTLKGENWYNGKGIYLPLIFCIVLFVFRVTSYDYSCQLGTRENDVFNTLYIADVTRRHNIAVLDCDQQYLLKFGWDIDCQKTDVDGADCVIIDKNLLEPGYSGPDFWKFYQTYETIDWDYIDTMRNIYENENFILYIK